MHRRTSVSVEQLTPAEVCDNDDDIDGDNDNDNDIDGDNDNDVGVADGAKEEARTRALQSSHGRWVTRHCTVDACIDDAFLPRLLQLMNSHRYEQIGTGSHCGL